MAFLNAPSAQSATPLTTQAPLYALLLVVSLGTVMREMDALVVILGSILLEGVCYVLPVNVGSTLLATLLLAMSARQVNMQIRKIRHFANLVL